MKLAWPRVVRRLWPDSLFARLALILCAGMATALSMSSALTFAERDQATARLMTGYIEREVASSVALLDLLPADARAAWLPRLARRSYHFVLGPGDPSLPQGEGDARLAEQVADAFVDGIGHSYPLTVDMQPDKPGHLQVHLRLSDGQPLTIAVQRMSGLPLSPWLPWVLAAQLSVLGLCCWFAVRQATRPLRALAEAADALGPDMRPVRLPERRGGDRLGRDGGEDLAEGHAELGLGQRPDLGEGNRRDLVLQALQLLRDLGRQDVEPRRQVLADLDHQAAEIERERVESPGEATHAPGPGPLGQTPQAEAGQDEFEPPGDGEMPRGEPQDAAVPRATGPVTHRRTGRGGVGRRHPRQSRARIE